MSNDEKNWREIDKRKDGSKHHGVNQPRMSKFKQERANIASQSYKAKLDSFFDGDGKVPGHLKEKFAALEASPEGKARKAAEKAIIDARTSSQRDSAVEKYLEKWELPTDYNILIEVLSCEDEELVELALDSIGEMFASNRSPKRTTLLEQRLKKVVSLADDDDVVDKANGLIKKLKNFK